MSTLAVIATSTLTGVIGAAAMYVPARLARHDARTYNQLAERKLDECEQRDAAYEQSRGVQPFWSFDAPELPAADPHVTGEVLHVEPHETGEHPVVESDVPINLCPECRLVSAHKPLCSRPVPLPWELQSDAMAIADQPGHDDDALADDTDRPGLWLVLLAPVWDLTDRAHDWLSVLIDDVRDRFKSDAARDAEFRQAQGDDLDEDESLSAAFDEAIALARASSPRHASDEVAQDKGYRGSRWAQDVQHTDLFPIVVIPEQRTGGDE